MTYIEARIRYAAWQANWWLEGGRIRIRDRKGFRKWIADRYSGMVMSKKIAPNGKDYVVWEKDFWSKAFLPVRRLFQKMIGEYSHRSDFTDKEAGLLHGGRGWSKAAFDKFIENIS